MDSAPTQTPRRWRPGLALGMLAVLLAAGVGFFGGRVSRQARLEQLRGDAKQAQAAAQEAHAAAEQARAAAEQARTRADEAQAEVDRYRAREQARGDNGGTPFWSPPVIQPEDGIRQPSTRIEVHHLRTFPGQIDPRIDAGMQIDAIERSRGYQRWDMSRPLPDLDSSVFPNR